MTRSTKTKTGFRLPFGYEGKHRDGEIRLLTQRDLIIIHRLAGDASDYASFEAYCCYLEVLILSRIVISLGDLQLDETNRIEIMQDLPNADVRELARVYEEVLLKQTQAEESPDSVPNHADGVRETAKTAQDDKSVENARSSVTGQTP